MRQQGGGGLDGWWMTAVILCGVERERDRCAIQAWGVGHLLGKIGDEGATYVYFCIDDNGSI